jgi:hypothetical protein
MEDITHYYRNFPVQPRDQINQLLVYPDTEVAIDHNENFGDRGTPFKTGSLGDVLCWILSKAPYNFEDASHYSDNFWATTSPERAIIDRARFQELFDSLGLPRGEKDSICGKQFKLIGFDWDIDAFTVSVPETKKEEILNKIIKFLDQGFIELKQLEKLRGQFVFISKIIQSASCYSSICWKTEGKYNAITKGFSATSKIHHKIAFKSEELLLESFEFFKRTLLTWSGTSFLRHLEWEEAKYVLGCSSDASKIGGSFTTPTHYGYYTWCKCCVDKNKHDMTTLELGAILIGLFFHNSRHPRDTQSVMAHRQRSKRVRLRQRILIGLPCQISNNQRNPPYCNSTQY